MIFTFATAGEFVFLGHLQAFVPLYLPHLGVAASDVPTVTGLSVALASAVGLPLLPFWGALADRYARHPVIVRSYVLYLVVAVLVLLARNVWVFILARALLGLALANSGLMLATLTERVPSHRQALAFSIVIAGYTIGSTVGPAVGGPVVDAYGFPTLILIDLALLGVVVVAMTLGYRDRFVGSNRGSLLAMTASSLLIIGRTPRLLFLFLAMTLLSAGFGLPSTFLPLVVTALYHGAEPGTVVGLVFGVSGLSALAAGPMMGFMADRWGLWRMLFVGTAAVVVLLSLATLAPEPISFAAVYALVYGIFTGVLTLSFNVLSSSVTDEVRGRVMALSTLPNNLALVVGPPLGGVVATLSLFAVFPLATGFTALGIVCLIAARRRPAPGPAPALPTAQQTA
jgi:DHA1 family multidrug resistance protein-like MFS transporter